jgi:cytochrome b subunit of formate dehydrogenase
MDKQNLLEEEEAPVERNCRCRPPPLWLIHLLWVPAILWLLCGLVALVFYFAVRTDCHWTTAQIPRCSTVGNTTYCRAMAKRSVAAPNCDAYWEAIVVLLQCFGYPLIGLLVLGIVLGGPVLCLVGVQ